MKTTLVIPDPIFKKAKSLAALQGISLRELVTEALAEKLRASHESARPWLNSFGALRTINAETVRINATIQNEFGQIEPADRV